MIKLFDRVMSPRNQKGVKINKYIPDAFLRINDLENTKLISIFFPKTSSEPIFYENTILFGGEK